MQQVMGEYSARAQIIQVLKINQVFLNSETLKDQASLLIYKKHNLHNEAMFGTMK